MAKKLETEIKVGIFVTIGIALIVVRRHDRRVPIPYGPFLAIAGWLTMMFAPELVQPWWPLAR